MMAADTNITIIIKLKGLPTVGYLATIDVVTRVNMYNIKKNSNREGLFNSKQ